MNPPTDRERPALSEVDSIGRALDMLADYVKTDGNFGSDTRVVSEARAVLAAWNIHASLKPAQRGVMDLVEALGPLYEWLYEGGHGVRVGQIINRIRDAATALERLAGERGGEAVAWVFECKEPAGWVRSVSLFNPLPDETTDYRNVRPLYAAPQPLAGEVEREEGLTDVFGRPFDGDDDPRLKVAEVVTRAEADAILEYRGDLVAILTAHPALGGGGR